MTLSLAGLATSFTSVAAMGCAKHTGGSVQEEVVALLRSSAPVCRPQHLALQTGSVSSSDDSNVSFAHL